VRLAALWASSSVSEPESRPSSTRPTSSSFLQERGRLRLTLEERHGYWFALVGGLPIQAQAEYLVLLLDEAGRALSPAQVRELEALMRRRLPRYPEPA
jgi:hypothetical protein